MKKCLSLLLALSLAVLPLTACGSASAASNGEVVVYNWGEYIDPETISMFEEETGIKVIYDEFETNEIMYPKIEAGASKYDVVCPSDYMIQKMIENDLLAELNYDNIPNAKKNIGEQYWEQSKQFDPENKYSVPYCWGTVGILYNKTLVQAYVIDQVRDKMIGNEAAIGVIYSGEAIYTQRENPDLEYVVPKEGTNVWIDSWVITKNAPNMENAEKFIDFMCRPEIALKNFEYITYSTPNDAARDLIEDEDIRNSKIAFPNLDEYNNLETFTYLGDDADSLYNELWKEVKSS